MEDSELVNQLKQGSTEAFDQLYSKYSRLALRTAYLITGNVTDSEDIVQEAFVKCFLYSHSIREESSFKSWLLRILARTAWNYSKKQKSEIPDEHIQEMAERGTESVLDIIVQEEKSVQLMQAVERLSKKQRTVVVLYYFNGLTTREIASIQGCMEGTVKSRLHTARRLLKKSLVDEVDKEVCLI